MRTTVLLLASAALLGACSATADDGDPEDSIAVDDGKADDFYSQSALEYVVTGRSSVTFTSQPTQAEVKKLISEKQIAIAWFLTQYLVDKEDEDANKSFGGYGGMAKGGMWEDLEVTPSADGLTYSFTFKQLVAGSKTLMSKLPIRTASGQQVFDLEIGKPTNDEMGQLVTNEEWYRNPPWDAWDPSKVDASQKEKITFAIAKERASTDAFFDMKRLTEDGKLDVDVFFGWDYHSNYHLKHSKELFIWLVNQGFKAPVSDWDHLTKDSGAFTKHLKADGKDTTIEVRIYFGKPGTATDPDTDAGGKVLEGIARESLTKRDVVIYSGHSGPFYGFALADWKKTLEGDLDDSEMRTIPLASKYQVVVAEGCDTYQIGEAFLENPAKAGKNVDVITTTSFSNAATPATVEDFMTALLAHDSYGRLRPQPVSTLLTKLDSESYEWGFHTMYGIHGIDNDPKLHPFANTAKFGTQCSYNSDCGGPGNLCVTMGTLGKRCTAACAATDGCPTDYTCKAVASSSTSTIYGKACAK
jgi:hypothetical protein